MLTTEYRGFNIHYKESEDQWITGIRGEELEEFSLRSLKKSIDKLLKKKVIGKKCIRLIGDNIAENCEITNMARSKSYRNQQEYWFKMKKTRFTSDLEHIYEDNEYNWGQIFNISEIQTQKEKLDQEIDEIKLNMIKLQLGDIKNAN